MLPNCSREIEKINNKRIGYFSRRDCAMIPRSRDDYKMSPFSIKKKNLNNSTCCKKALFKIKCHICDVELKFELGENSMDIYYDPRESALDVLEFTIDVYRVMKKTSVESLRNHHFIVKRFFDKKDYSEPDLLDFYDNPLCVHCGKKILSDSAYKKISETYENEKRYGGDRVFSTTNYYIQSHMIQCENFSKKRQIMMKNTCREDLIATLRENGCFLGEKIYYNPLPELMSYLFNITSCPCDESNYVECLICGTKKVLIAHKYPQRINRAHKYSIHKNPESIYKRIVRKHFGVGKPRKSYLDLIVRINSKLEEYEAVMNNPNPIYGAYYDTMTTKCEGYSCVICGKEYGRNMFRKNLDPDNAVNCPSEEVVFAHFRECAPKFRDYFHKNGYNCDL